MTDRCREKRTAALRRLIEDAEASGISVDEIFFAEARTWSDERRRRADPTIWNGGACGREAAEKVQNGRVPLALLEQMTAAQLRLNGREPPNG